MNKWICPACKRRYGTEEALLTHTQWCLCSTCVHIWQGTCKGRHFQVCPGRIADQERTEEARKKTLEGGRQ